MTPALGRASTALAPLCMALVACSLLASAQSGKEPEGISSSPPAPEAKAPAADRKGRRKPSAADVKEIEARGAVYFEQCMRDWDAATHMTKQEWSRTCRRVADERMKFLREQTQ
jgi:hypothetical protein